MLLNDKWVNNEIKEEIKNYLETNKNEHPAYQKPMEHSKRIPEREVHSITGLPNEDRKISEKWPNPTSTRTRGTTNKAQSKWKEGNKIRAELNDIETKKIFKKSVNPGAGSWKRYTKLTNL